MGERTTMPNLPDLTCPTCEGTGTHVTYSDPPPCWACGGAGRRRPTLDEWDVLVDAIREHDRRWTADGGGRAGCYPVLGEAVRDNRDVDMATVRPFRHLADEFYRNSPGARLRVGEKVRELREELGLTQEDVAEKVRTSQPGVSAMEHRTDMHISTLAKLANALGGQLRLFIDLPGGDHRELMIWPGNAGNHPDGGVTASTHKGGDDG